jgi:uridine kinase
MANKILIHVSGTAGSGKSTITEIISRTLTENGIMIEHDYTSMSIRFIDLKHYHNV